MMKKVLVTNDDGIDVIGLTSLVEALAPLADVYVAAPMEQQSAKSQSITIMKTIRIEERQLKGAAAAYAVEGTPTDCIKLVLDKLEDEGIRPDYLISGINMGLNLGLAAYYSGTIAGAREGALHGIRSIALSVGTHDTTQFDYILGNLPLYMELADRLSPSSFISVNAPSRPSWDIKGMRIVPAAPYGYGEDFVFRQEEDGGYLMRAEPARMDDRMRYDFDWVRAGYATVSPLPTSLEDPVALMKLREQVEASECLTVIVDAQKGVLDEIRKPKRFRKNIGKFARAMARMNAPILIAETHGLGLTLDEVEACAKEAERVAHVKPDIWTSPDTFKYVGAADTDRILIAGASTNVAVLQTAVSFAEQGFDVTVIKDCCSAESKSSHRAALDLLREKGCRISTCETAVMQIAGTCERVVMESVKRILAK